MTSDIFRDFAKDVFGFIAPDVPETIPLRLLGLTPPIPNRQTIVSAFRRRVIERHPDMQLAYDHPAIQEAAADALGDKPEIRELVWARDVLIERAHDSEAVTGATGFRANPFYPSPPRERKCWHCQRTLESRQCVVGGRGRRRGWCYRCVADDDQARAAERRRRRRANRRCAGPGCTEVFTPSRSDGRFCSHRCRQAAYRGRVTTKSGTTVVPLLSVTPSTQEAS